MKGVNWVYIRACVHILFLFYDFRYRRSIDTFTKGRI